MKILRLVALSIVVGLFAESGTTSAATYTYSGGNFVDVLGNYTTMMRVSAQFSVAAPLAPNLPFTDTRAFVTSYSFNDGVQTLTEANSTLLSFSVSTDATGAIATWTISAGVLIGDSINQISTSFNDGNTFDRAFTDRPCSVVTTDPRECLFIPETDVNVGTLDLTTQPAPGSWTCSDGCTNELFTGQATTYAYLGNNYTSVGGSYTTDMHLMLSFTVPAPLRADLPLSDISALIIAYRFDDGQRIFTQAGPSLESFSVSVTTDSSGNISDWAINSETGFATPQIGERNFVIFSNAPGSFGTEGGFVSECTEVSSGACTGLLQVEFAETGDLGMWTQLTAPPVTFFFPQIGEGVAGEISLDTQILLEHINRVDPSGNLDTDAALVVDFFSSPDGAPMPVTIEGRGTAASFDLTLPAGATVFLSTPGTTDPLQVGFARVRGP